MSDTENLYAQLEALLFVSDEPVTPATLAEICEIDLGETITTLAQIQADYHDRNCGIQLREVAGGWRFYTHPAFHEVIERYLLSWDTHKLSQASLEALAVIAYHQPVTRQGVNAVRGVSSAAVISSLVEKGLVREVGRDNGPGNAILYGTTRTFLEKFGLRSLHDLPPLEEFAPDEESRKLIRERLSAGSIASSAFETEESLGGDLDLADGEGATIWNQVEDGDEGDDGFADPDVFELER